MKGAVYRIRDPDGDGDVVIVDHGYKNGNLHIYRHAESVQVNDLIEQAEEEGLQTESRAYLGHTLSKLHFDTNPNHRWEFTR
jgi:uncharacterized protein (UPF0264 family)